MELVQLVQPAHGPPQIPEREGKQGSAAPDAAFESILDSLQAFFSEQKDSKVLQDLPDELHQILAGLLTGSYASVQEDVNVLLAESAAKPDQQEHAAEASDGRKLTVSKLPGWEFSSDGKVWESLGVPRLMKYLKMQAEGQEGQAQFAGSDPDLASGSEVKAQNQPVQSASGQKTQSGNFLWEAADQDERPILKPKLSSGVENVPGKDQRVGSDQVLHDQNQPGSVSRLGSRPKNGTAVKAAAELTDRGEPQRKMPAGNEHSVESSPDGKPRIQAAAEGSPRPQGKLEKTAAPPPQVQDSKSPVDEPADGKQSSRKPDQLENNSQLVQRAEEGSPVDPARFTKAEMQETPQLNPSEQISSRIEDMLDKQQSRFRLQLKPRHMGGIEIRLSRGEDGVQVNIQAESQHTAVILEKHLNELRNSLAQSGIKLLDLTVGQGKQETFQSRQQSASRHQLQTAQPEFQGTREEELILTRSSLVEYLI